MDSELQSVTNSNWKIPRQLRIWKNTKKKENNKNDLTNDSAATTKTQEQNCSDQANQNLNTLKSEVISLVENILPQTRDSSSTSTSPFPKKEISLSSCVKTNIPFNVESKYYHHCQEALKNFIQSSPATKMQVNTKENSDWFPNDGVFQVSCSKSINSQNSLSFSVKYEPGVKDKAWLLKKYEEYLKKRAHELRIDRVKLVDVNDAIFCWENGKIRMEALKGIENLVFQGGGVKGVGYGGVFLIHFCFHKFHYKLTQNFPLDFSFLF